jgi:hypothetical protein
MNKQLLASLLLAQAAVVSVYGFSPALIRISRVQHIHQNPKSFGWNSELSMEINAPRKNIFSRFNKGTESNKKKVVRIPVKPRPIVSLDEETGKYIPSLTDAISTKGGEAPKPKEQNTVVESNQVSGWDAFKGGVYNIVDGISSITRRKSTNSITDRKIAVAYSDTIESLPLKSPATSPLSRKGKKDGPRQKIMEQYQASLKTTSDTKPRDLSNGENLFQTDLRKSFDSAKDSIYGTIDNLSANEKVRSSIPNTQEDVNKVPSKPSINKNVEVSTLSLYVQDLNSVNPLKRLKANLAIAGEDRKRKRRAAEANRRAAMDGLKRIMFDFVDTVQVMYGALLNTPAQLERSLLGTQDTFDVTMIQIKSTPDKIQQVLENTKKSVEETQRVTMDVVEEVKTIPQKVTTSAEEVVAGVETSINNTKETIEQTKQGMFQFVQKVGDITNEAKYITGLEQRPLPPPPPPRTTEELAKDVAMDVAKGTASIAGKAGLVVAKGTAGMAVSGAKLAWQAATSTEQPKGEMTDATRDIPFVAAADMAETPKTIAEIDPTLEAEVVEALRVAEQALAAPNVEATAPTMVLQKKRTSRRTAVGPKDIDINEAVKRAKNAAAQTKRDVDELEAMLAERQVVKK